MRVAIVKQMEESKKIKETKITENIYGLEGILMLEKRDLALAVCGLKKASLVDITEANVIQLNRILKELGTPHRFITIASTTNWGHCLMLCIGTKKKNVIRLMNAYFEQDNYLLGLALDYPKSAVEHFCSDPKHGIYYNQELKRIGPDNIPEELAFLPFVPSRFKNGRLPKEEARIAKAYAEFFRQRHERFYKGIIAAWKELKFGG